MPREDAIALEGQIVEVLRRGLFRVELANGHRLMGHALRKDQDAVAELAVGARVRLEMSPFDMSKGRIVI